MIVLEPYEKETAIYWNEEEDDYATIETNSNRVVDRLLGLGLQPYEVEKEWGSYWFKIPRKAIRIKIGRLKSCYITGRRP